MLPHLREQVAEQGHTLLQSGRGLQEFIYCVASPNPSHQFIEVHSTIHRVFMLTKIILFFSINGWLSFFLLDSRILDFQRSEMAMNQIVVLRDAPVEQFDLNSPKDFSTISILTLKESIFCLILWTDSVSTLKVVSILTALRPVYRIY